MNAGLIIDVDEKKRLVVGLDLPTVKEA
ncbi:orotidine-5'-phosphate decarboxylase, partial [Candidatus Liberibacter asiaticus]